MSAYRTLAKGILGRASRGGAVVLALAACVQSQRGPADSPAGDELAAQFRTPPPSARPWVYWFWLNGNITAEGITADLEAMERVGIGGVLIMEVDQGAPVGPVDFVSPKWRELFQHVVAEAGRLGLEVNMNNDAGWNGSGGPWIRPEESMQKVVWTDTDIEGPRRFEGVLPPPEAVAGFYRDIAVLAFPAPGPYRIEGIGVKAGYEIGAAAPAATASLEPAMAIERWRIADLTTRMNEQGGLAWDVPAGKWTIVRFGHTSTGVVNAPAPASGRGFECDKLSRAGIEANFAGLMAKLIADAGPAAGQALAATHIDSWENGAQNWTTRMREEFQARRGYDLVAFLPVFTGRVVDGLEVSERFLWDLRQTISDLILENYAGRMRELARAHGLRLSIEAYVAPCDELAYAGRCDEPMGEFWTPSGGMIETLKEMASSAHTYGRPIVGAEAFTAGGSERWLLHPASLKALGDRAFCDGINRFVFHRYAMQPWLDRRPGMTMGPWGQHYERTQTWWDWTPGWHEYLARSQHMLRQGLFVADLCYLQPEAAPQGLVGHARQPYDYDHCPAEVVRTRMAVEDGRIVLPDGMSYRLLVLPETRIMTPALLGRIAELVAAGATVVGPKPLRSPSLEDYPRCDQKVERIAGELYGNCDGESITEHRFGKGRVVWGIAPEEVLARDGVPPDFAGPPTWRAIHRATRDADIYFVANQESTPVRAACTFRGRGKDPELWWPESGRIEPAPSAVEEDGVTRVLLSLGPVESVFVVFRARRDPRTDPVVAVRRDGEPLWSMHDRPARPIVRSARYGVLDDPARTRDVTAKAQALVDGGELSFPVARLAEGDDPAYGIVKTVVIEVELDGRRQTVTGTDPETIRVAPPAEPGEQVELRRGTDGRLSLEASRPGRYTLALASGTERELVVPGLPAPRTVEGPWQVRFPAGSGAPAEIVLERLISLAESADPGVRYFSGAASYATTIEVPAEMLASERRLHLDLGRVEVMAGVTLNGRRLGTWWKLPFRVDITAAARAGTNALEVTVVNLWPNRMIGDEVLPEDSDRNPDGTLRSWPAWLQAGEPSPTGRFTFTTWRLWAKDAALLPSGLIGPVTLECTALVPVER
ncbi:MAG: glycosyl hydrolase [Planctomycetota bacterium]